MQFISLILAFILFSFGCCPKISQCKELTASHDDSRTIPSQHITMLPNLITNESRICFGVYFKNREKKQLFNKFIKGSILEKFLTETSNYHVGLGCVKTGNINSSGKIAIKRFLGIPIQAYFKVNSVSNHQPVIFVPKKADHYLVGKRTYQNSSIVLYTDEASKFIYLNKLIVDRVNEFNMIFDAKLEIEEDYLPDNYLAHVTLVDENQLETISNSLNKNLQEFKSEIIYSFNLKLGNEGFILSTPNFKYQQTTFFDP
jgi:hypothetical protein